MVPAMSKATEPASVHFIGSNQHRYRAQARWKWDSTRPRLLWPGWLIYVIHSGSAVMTGPWGEAEVSSRQVACLCMSQGSYQIRQGHASALELTWVHISTTPDSPHLLPNLCAPKYPDFVQRLAHRCFDTSRERRVADMPSWRPETWASALVDEVIHRSHPVMTEHGLQDRRILDLSARMKEHPARAWDFTEEAKRLKMPYSTFFKHFVRCMGDNPRDYLMKLRVFAAKSLLRETSLTLDDIAQAVGVSNRSLLTRLFTRIVGRTPSAYRKVRIAEKD